MRRRSRAEAVIVLVALAAWPATLAPAAAAPRATLESLEVYPTPASIPPGGAFGFGAIATYSDGSRKEVTKKAKFFASDPGVAAPLGKNVFGGASVGVSEIRATLGTLASSQNALLTVSPIASIAIEPDEEGIRLGTRFQFGAVATLANGTEDVEVTRLLDWTSFDPGVLSIGNGKKDKALAKTAALGATQVQARDPRTGVRALKPVQIVTELLAVVVDPSSRVLQLDDARRFQAIGQFESSSDESVEADISPDVRWSASNRAVATIDKSGRPAPRALGETTIGASDRKTAITSGRGGGDAVLTVVGRVLALTVTPAAAELAVGEDQRFDALALFAGNPSTFSWGRRVGWSSSDPAVASVDGSGEVRCEGPGQATLVASDPKSTVTSTKTGGDGQVTCK